MFFAECKKKEVKIGFLTLHVASGTYQPIKTNNIEDHRMHSEYFEITEKVSRLIKNARHTGGRIIAIGTTVLRALESLYLHDSQLLPFRGETDIFIRPGFDFGVVDALVTNFHLPKSTLLMLVSAFAGFDEMKAAYQHAVDHRYRFFSYGDGCLLEKKK